MYLLLKYYDYFWKYYEYNIFNYECGIKMLANYRIIIIIDNKQCTCYKHLFDAQ